MCNLSFFSTSDCVEEVDAAAVTSPPGLWTSVLKPRGLRLFLIGFTASTSFTQSVSEINTQNKFTAIYMYSHICDGAPSLNCA